jgi:hypothetical protein
MVFVNEIISVNFGKRGLKKHPELENSKPKIDIIDIR